MEALLIALPSSLAYLGLWLLTARLVYARKRLLTEPLGCERPDLHPRYGSHYSACYRQNHSDLIDSNGEAAALALFLGAIWPLMGPKIAAMWLVQAGQQETLAEVRAKNARLERELGMRNS